MSRKNNVKNLKRLAVLEELVVVEREAPDCDVEMLDALVWAIKRLKFYVHPEMRKALMAASAEAA